MLAACGGDKARPSAGGDQQYLDRVLAILSGCGGPQLSVTPQVDELAAAERFQVEEWDKLVPPPDLADVHRAYREAMQRTAEILAAVPVGEKLDPNSTQAAELRDATSVLIHYRDAVKAHYGVTVFRSTGHSMEPALGDGDTIAPHSLTGTAARWQILVFKLPLDPSREFIKRIVGLPGEIVEVHDGRILINGEALEDDVFAKETPNYTYTPKLVPADSYWVLGDNRRNSYDSHAWGNSCTPAQQCDFVPKANILGVLPPDTKGCKAGASG